MMAGWNYIKRVFGIRPKEERPHPKPGEMWVFNGDEKEWRFRPGTRFEIINVYGGVRVRYWQVGRLFVVDRYKNLDKFLATYTKLRDASTRYNDFVLGLTELIKTGTVAPRKYDNK